jgi:uncharacterized membrane protein
MLLYFINVIDNTWYLAVGFGLVFLVLLGLRQFDAGSRKRAFVWGGLAAGLLAAVTLAVLRRQTGWVVREFYDLGVLWPLGLSLIIFIIFYPTPQARLVTDSPRTLYVGSAVIACLTALSLPNLLLYPLDFGVGLDSFFNLDYLKRLRGYAFGLVLLGFLGLTMLSQARRVPQNILKVFLLAGFIVLLSFILLKTAQIMTVRGMLPRSRQLTRVVIFFLNHENIFLFGQIFIWGILSLVQMIRSYAAKPAGANPAHIRRSKANLRLQSRLGKAVLISLIAVFLSITSLRAYQNRGPDIADPQEVSGKDGIIELDLKVIGDGQLHRHQYKTKSGTPVRFIVIRKSDTAYGVGLDACDICGQSGYYQRGDQVICKLCDVVMNKVTIGFPGGCNPVPLDFLIKDGKLLVETQNLENEKGRFQ